MHIKNKKGQSTVEYVLLMTAVIVVIIAFVGTKNSGFQAQLNSALNQAAADMNSEAGQLTTSHAATPAPTGTISLPYSVDVAKGVGT